MPLRARLEGPRSLVNSFHRRGPLLAEKRQRLQANNLERFAAADVGAGQFVIAAHHVGLGLGETGAVALVRLARQLRSLAADDPRNLVFVGLPAFRTGKDVRAQLRALGKEFPLFHGPSPLEPSKGDMPDCQSRNREQGSGTSTPRT